MHPLLAPFAMTIRQRISCCACAIVRRTVLFNSVFTWSGNPGEFAQTIMHYVVPLSWYQLNERHTDEITVLFRLEQGKGRTIREDNTAITGDADGIQGAFD